jgi:hypothetical protein
VLPRARSPREAEGEGGEDGELVDEWRGGASGETKGPAAVKMELGSGEVDEEVLWARIDE